MLELIFISFGLFFLGFVLAYSGYDVWKRQRLIKLWNKKVGLLMCMIFLVISGVGLSLIGIIISIRLWDYSRLLLVANYLFYLLVVAACFKIIVLKEKVDSQYLSKRNKE